MLKLLTADELKRSISSIYCRKYYVCKTPGIIYTGYEYFLKDEIISLFYYPGLLPAIFG
jgi:hypothetical protein